MQFFIPKKPTAFQDSLSIHWLIVQGALPPTPASINTPHQHQATTAATLALVSTRSGSSPSLTQSDGNTAVAAFTEDANGSTTTNSTIITQNDISNGSLTFPNFTSTLASAQSSVSPPGNSTSTIDLDKVRQMLSQVQIDNMPQGAKDLMRTMEMQSLALRALSSSYPSATASSVGGHLSPSPITSPLPPLSYTATPPITAAAPPTLPVVTTSSLPGVAAEVSTVSTTIFVTRAELALMEERIMAKIEQRFQEMEETILNKLLAAKQPHA
ncbi:hypothetical protein BGW39_004215 [Mortierella sp. 14UC]|nr:hypothetical protein BGW39_004215 [Mortierella sp. 14UC]